MSITDELIAEVEAEASRRNLLIVEKLFIRLEEKMNQIRDCPKSCVHQAVKTEYVRLKRQYYRSRGFHLREYGYVGCDNDEAVSGLLGSAHQRWLSLRAKYRTFERCNTCEACKTDDRLRAFYKERRRKLVQERAAIRLAAKKVRIGVIP